MGAGREARNEVARLPPLLALAVLLGAGVAGATPTPTAEPTPNATATDTPVDVQELLERINDSDGDGVPDAQDLAPYHPGIRDRSDLDPGSGGGGFGFGAALIALLAAAGLAARRR